MAKKTNARKTDAKAKNSRARVKNPKNSFLARHTPKLVFLLSFVLGYFIMPPVIAHDFLPLVVIFLFTFALSMSCFAHSAIQNMKHVKSHGALSIIAAVFGFAAISACGIGFSCGLASVQILSIVIPAFFLHYLAQYGAYIILAAILAQMLALWQMKCRTRKALKELFFEQ